MTERRVFTIRLANYLTKKGFKYIKRIQDLDKPNFYNWIFEDTPELNAAIEEYKELKMREGGKND